MSECKRASILNLNSMPIKNIRGIAIFYPGVTFNHKKVQKSEYPIHYKLFTVKETVPPKLALRFYFGDYTILCRWFVKLRILDYDLIQDNSEIISIPTFE